MVPMIAFTLPAMQLVCNLVIPEVPGINGTDFVNKIPPSQLTAETRETSKVRSNPGILPEGYVPFPEFGMAYKVHTESAQWLVALKRCIEEGGGLAVIDSWEKYDQLHQHPLMTELNNFPHVGIVRVDGKWVNANTGYPVPMVPWADGEPRSNRDCVGYSLFRGLEDYFCTQEYSFVCEHPLP